MIERRELRNRIILVIATVLFMLVAMEMACRALRGTWFFWHWPNLVLHEARQHGKRPCSFVPDVRLGYVPEADCSAPEHSHDKNGLRLMPPPPADTPANAPAVLVTGDSYAYADEVKDDETWAVYLQGMIHRRVENGGVPGYGLDQTVLRTEDLAPRFKPGLIVLAFIADDLQRAEMRRLFGGEKPYFTVNGGTLELHNTPVVPRPVNEQTLPAWQRWIGWSMLVDKSMRFFGHYSSWFWQDANGTPAGTGETLACPLMRKIAALKVPTLVVAQYRPHLWTYERKWADEQRRLSKVVLQCAETAGLSAYDTYDLLDGAVKAQGLGALYGDWHHSAAGNNLVARGISAELVRLKLLP